MRSEQKIGRVVGKGHLKVIGDAGQDEERQQLVWVLCRNCLTVKTVRWSNAKRNATCGCGRDQNVRRHAEEAIGRVPWPLKLRIWAAAQEKASTTEIWKQFADDVRPYRLEKHERDQLVRTVFVELTSADEETRWTQAEIESIAWLRHSLDNHIDRYDGRKGELDRSEFAAHSDGRSSGVYADLVVKARAIRARLEFLADADTGVLKRLRQCGIQLPFTISLANWLLNEVRYTQEQRDKRRKRGIERAVGAKLSADCGAISTERPDQDLVAASWSPETQSEWAD